MSQVLNVRVGFTGEPGHSSVYWKRDPNADAFIVEFSPDPILRATDLGPAWLTGGSYGIEGGIACTLAILISIGLIYYLPSLKSEPPAVAVG